MKKTARQTQTSNLAIFACIFTLICATASANVDISKHKTKNMSCSGGICTPTAKNAVLNINGLAHMLATSDVKINTGGGAVTIGVTAPLHWVSAHRLTLDAQQSVHIRAPITVEGAGAITLLTNDGGSAGDLQFFDSGSIGFWNLSSSLIINGQSYVLFSDIKSLAAGIVGNSSGSFALANDYDAGVDGVYGRSPILEKLEGTFDAMGHTIKGLQIVDNTKFDFEVGLFAFIDFSGIVRDLNLVDAKISAHNRAVSVGSIAGLNHGTVKHVTATSEVKATGRDASAGGLLGDNNQGAVVYDAAVTGKVKASGRDSSAGGLAGTNFGEITNASSAGVVSGQGAGGLVDYNAGTITQSFSEASVNGSFGDAGGLVEFNSGYSGYVGYITNSYSTGAVNGYKYTGGLVGVNGGYVTNAYATGSASSSENSLGGLVGFDESDVGFSNTYWNLDTSGVNDPSKGAGNIIDDPGIIGLTDAQLKSALPAGFDPAIWDQKQQINAGYPYLLAFPPR
jgi:hypothetical protein